MTSQELNQAIRSGETHNVKFKSSMRFDFKEKRVNKELTKVISKTIAGFMNAAGGVLLIGVRDDGKIIGIQQDLNTLKKKRYRRLRDVSSQRLKRLFGLPDQPTC